MIEALFTRELVSGAGAGAVGLALVLVIAAVRRDSNPTSVPVVGLALAAAAVAVTALVVTKAAVRTPGEVLVGLGALAAVGLLADLWPRCRPALALLALPGAVLLASAAERAYAANRQVDPRFVLPPRWFWVVVVVAVAVGGPLVGAFDARWRSQGYGPILLAVTVAGAYLTVPDTERMLVLLGAAGVLVLSAWPWPLGSLGRAGSLSATGLVVWAATLDGAYRSSSVVGAVACLGLLVVEPVARGMLRRHRSPLEGLQGKWWSVPAVAAFHLAVVLVASRGAGLRPDLGEAALVAGADLVVALVLVLAAAAILGAHRTRPVGY